MPWFKCKHPAARLVVERDSTISLALPGCEDPHDVITHHLKCRACDHLVEIRYAKPRFTTEELIRNHGDRLSIYQFQRGVK